jgi:hypothetical protein
VAAVVRPRHCSRASMTESQERPAATASFWKRQFQHRATSGQRTLDACLGLGGPLMCLVLDPGLFRQPSGHIEGALLDGCRVYVHSEIALGVLVLGYFLAFQRASPVVAGCLFGSTVFSLLLGLLLAPLSILLLNRSTPIAAFGFMPLITGLIFSRNAYRCYCATLQPPCGLSSEPKTRSTIVLVAALTLIVPGIPDCLVRLMLGPVPPVPLGL